MTTNWPYYIAGLATYLVYRIGYWRGKRRGLELGERIGYNERKRKEYLHAYGGRDLR